MNLLQLLRAKLREALLLFSFCLVSVGLGAQSSQKEGVLTLESLNQKILVEIDVKSPQLSYTLVYDGIKVLNPSPIGMNLASGEKFGVNPQLLSSSLTKHNEAIQAPIYKKKQIKDEYNQLLMTFKNDFSVLFRAYDDGVAYRILTKKNKEIVVTDENVSYVFADNYNSMVPYIKERRNDGSIEQQFYSSFQSYYSTQPLLDIKYGRLMLSPLLIELDRNHKAVIGESDVEDYPGTHLIHYGGNTLTGISAPYPKKEVQGGHNNLQMIVAEREDYLAKTSGNRAFPWRFIVLSENDVELANSDMVYKLASPPRFTDYSWIKPGKVAWDWWNSWNLEGVDFRTGVNNDTYKFYIDFASKYGLEYVILDEGWSVHGTADLYQVIPEIDIAELVAYGKERNVDIVLWAGFEALNKDIEGICRHYAQMGVKGFKVDFMDRDDQKVVNFHYKVAEAGARHKLLINFHGTYKPTGLQRTYPNVINFEGINGLEQMKWAEPSTDQVTYDVTVPYIRMLAGPVDYTQGATKNVAKGYYQPIYHEPMSQGTRCRQLAMYVIFESPMNMLCDTPTNYMKEEESLKFISDIPTVWDDTKGLEGKVGEYIVMARRTGNEWYIGGMTNWDEREVKIDLSFLNTGEYKVELFKDGINADKKGTDYKKDEIRMRNSEKITVKMMPGGGFAAKITPL